MSTTGNEFLGTEPIGKLLAKLAIPTVTAQLINMLYNIVDRIYIGHIPQSGALALTGVGVCLPIILCISAFAALVSMGGAPRSSIAMGKNDKDGAEKILGNCFSAQIIVSVVLTLVILIFNRQILLAFGASENTIGYATSYMTVYAIGTIFVQLTLGMNAFITAEGFTRTSMVSVLIGAGTNIILDPIFIFGLNLGVRGAAIATVISQAISCIWVLSFLLGKKTVIRLKKANFGIKREILLPCILLGLAPFIMQISESIISVCFNSSLLKYGGDLAVGAMTILTSIMQFTMMPLQGIGQGAQPIMSYNYGAGKADRVKASFFTLLKADIIYAVSLWALAMFAPKLLISLFTNDATLIAFATKALRIYMAASLIFGVQISCQMAFTSLGMAKESIMVASMRKFILLVPLIYIMPQLLRTDQTMAVYLAEPIADFGSVIFASSLFIFKFRKVLGEMKRLPENK
jgi:putative efflux protein, MATE family